jgi:hypothetical protein
MPHMALNQESNLQLLHFSSGYLHFSLIVRSGLTVTKCPWNGEREADSAMRVTFGVASQPTDTELSLREIETIAHHDMKCDNCLCCGSNISGRRGGFAQFLCPPSRLSIRRPANSS